MNSRYSFNIDMNALFRNDNAVPAPAQIGGPQGFADLFQFAPCQPIPEQLNQIDADRKFAEELDREMNHTWFFVCYR